MNFMDLIKADEQAEGPVKVITPYGPGELNSKGLDASYVAFDDPDPTILKRLRLLANKDIKEVQP